MNDDENEERQHFMQIGPFVMPAPPEVIAKVSHDLAASESTRHDYDRWMRTAFIEDLVTVRRMLSSTRNSEEPLQTLSFFEGQVTAVLEFVHGVCGDCGRNHEVEEMQELVKTVTPEVPQVPRSKPSDSEDVKYQIEKWGVPIDDAPEYRWYGYGPDDYANMSKYNIEDRRDEETGELIGYFCKNCDLQYSSVADRMMKAPDGCHGCHIKAAHG